PVFRPDQRGVVPSAGGVRNFTAAVLAKGVIRDESVRVLRVRTGDCEGGSGQRKCRSNSKGNRRFHAGLQRCLHHLLSTLRLRRTIAVPAASNSAASAIVMAICAPVRGKAPVPM